MSNFFSPLAMDQDSNDLPDISQFYESETTSGKRSRNEDNEHYSIPTQFLFRTVDIRSLEPGSYLNATNPFANVPPENSIRSFRSVNSPDIIHLTSLSAKDLTQCYQEADGVPRA
jgi:hypothetical protein